MKAVVIGCGRMGARHVQALQELEINVCGLFDLMIENCKKTAIQSSLPLSIVFENLDELFKTTQPDLCIIATTAPSHKDYIFKAISYGVKKILCEKPLSISIQACYDIIQLAESEGVDIAVNHQMRFLDQYIIPKQLLNSEEFGGLESITVNAGNFGIAMNGSHYIEMMRFMYDEYPVQVSAWFDKENWPNPRGANFIDKSGCLRLITSSGKKFYLDASASNGHGIIVTYTAKRGQIVIDELSGQMYSTHRNIGDKDLPSTRYGQPSIIKKEAITAVDIIKSTKAVLQSLINGREYPSLQDATHAIKALVAAYVSSDNDNVPIKLEDKNLPLTREFPWA